MEQEIEIQKKIENDEKKMREAAVKPDNELLRDKLQIKEEDILTENKKGRKEKKEAIWSGDNNTTKETESLS